LVAVASGALLPGFLGGRGVCGFADPAGRIAGGEGFFGGFFDGVDRRVEIFGSCGAIGRSRVLIFCGIRHERNHSADGVGGGIQGIADMDGGCEVMADRDGRRRGESGVLRSESSGRTENPHPLKTEGAAPKSRRGCESGVEERSGIPGRAV